MDVFTNTKKMKKIIIVLVFIMLFNFSFPKNIKAGDGGDVDERIVVTIESLFFWIFDGIQEILNEFFIDSAKQATNSVTAENVIKGKLLLLDPNIFKRITTDDGTYLDYTKISSERNTLRETISGWYYALRNLAMVALLSILVYVGIRMILSTISQDKAKYKIMFKDWLIALCLLFIIHYIMIGILNVSSTITEAIGTSGQSYTQDLKESIQSKLDYANTLLEGTVETGIMDEMKKALKETVIYAAMVIMNVIFVVKYCIRALTLIFLTLLAPICCITYPIDKISDGKAQAYDMWFKEFLYQVIIQPFHLLIYVVLIGSAAELAAENLIYAMLCFGVMIPAEKFIKQMFGFKDKLGSPLGAFAGGAVAGQLMNSLKSIGKGGGGGKDNDSNKTDDLPPNTKDIELPGGDDGDTGGGPGGGGPGGGGPVGPEEETPTEETVPPGGGGPGEDTPPEETVPPGDGENNDGVDPYLDEEDSWYAYNDRLAQQSDTTPGDGENNDGVDPYLDEEDSWYAYNDRLAQQSDTTPTTPPVTTPTTPDSVPTTPGTAVTTPDTTPDTTPPTPPTPDTTPPTPPTPPTTPVTTPTTPATTPVTPTTPGRWERAYRAVNSRASQHYLRKYGTTKIKGKNGIAVGMAKRGLNKAYKGSKNIGRKAIKGAATLAGAAALGAFGAMFGQGKEMALVGAGLGAKLGGSVTDKTDKIADVVEGYVGDAHNAFWDNGAQRDKEKFKEDRNNIRLARQNYKNRNGKEAKGDALNEELERMYTMDSHGIKKDQYNSVLSQYEEYVLPLDEGGAYGLGEEEAMNTAMLSAKQAQIYSSKDFRDGKAMEQAYDELYKQYIPYITRGEISEGQANKNIERILTGGAKMKGVQNPPLPSRRQQEVTQTVDVPVNREIPELATALGISEPEMTEERVQTMTNLRIRLVDAGYTDEQIRQIAELSADSTVSPAQVMTIFENNVNASVEYLENSNARHEAQRLVRSMNAEVGGKAPKKQVDAEMRDRFILKSTFNVENERDISAMRDTEVETFKPTEKTQIQAARDFAKANRGRMNDTRHIESKKEELRQSLRAGAQGTVSEEKIQRDVDNIARLAEIYVAD